MSALKKLAQMIGVRADQVDDALACEQRAQRAVRLSRRGFFAAGAAMATAPLVPTRAYSFLFGAADSLLLRRRIVEAAILAAAGDPLAARAAMYVMKEMIAGYILPVLGEEQTGNRIYEVPEDMTFGKPLEEAPREPPRPWYGYEKR